MIFFLKAVAKSSRYTVSIFYRFKFTYKPFFYLVFTWFNFNPPYLALRIYYIKFILLSFTLVRNWGIELGIFKLFDEFNDEFDVDKLFKNIDVNGGGGGKLYILLFLHYY